MDNNAITKISYGLYVLTARDGNKDNGCIINTVMQVSVNPDRLAVCVSKSNLTNDMIEKTGNLNLSILNTEADFELFKHFGFKSGRETEKFKDYKYCERSNNGIYYLTKSVNAFISAEIEKSIDVGSHIMYIGRIKEMKVINDLPPVTYEYYHANIKPKPEGNNKGKTVWRCKICGYEYVGETLPEDFICPLCKHPASDFEKIEG